MKTIKDNEIDNNTDSILMTFNTFVEIVLNNIKDVKREEISKIAFRWKDQKQHEFPEMVVFNLRKI